MREPLPEAVFNLDGQRPEHYQMLAYRIQPASSLADTTAESLRRFTGLRVVATTRGERLLFPKPGFVYTAKDQLYLLAPEQYAHELGLLFRGGGKRNEPKPSTFFGSFTINGQAGMQELAGVYGIALDEQWVELTIADFMRRRLRRRPVEGDLVELKSLRLTVRTLAAGVIDQVGMQLVTRSAGEDAQPAD